MATTAAFGAARFSLGALKQGLSELLIYALLRCRAATPPRSIRFKLRLGFKDLRLVQEAAESAAVPMPLAGVLRDHFLAAMARGEGDLDWAAVGRIAAVQAGL